MVKIIDNYCLSKLIGQGQYGKVYYAHNLQTKIQVAIKIIPIMKFVQIGKLTQLTKNQLQLLKLLQDNVNIINFVQMLKSSKNLYLVYEFCEGGTLEDFITAKRQERDAKQRMSFNNKPRHGIMRMNSTGYATNMPKGLIMPQKEALLIFKQLINAFKSLYEHNIIHRDVKPNNIFFKSGHLKLADFGFCKKLKSQEDITQTSLGSPMYMAPQILNGDIYGSKADIWSVGIVLYEILFGVCPFSQCKIKDLMELYNSTQGNVPMNQIIQIPPNTLSPTCQVMLMRMLEKDQFRRISWQQFFYQYQITEYGGIVRKQKDFQYDLMKLMKKTSSQANLSTLKRKQSLLGPLVKFDWSKITDMASSIHSQQLENQNLVPPISKPYHFEHKHTKNQLDLDAIYKLKKKTKQFQQDHQKMLDLSQILQALISTDKSHQQKYSQDICYIIAYNIQKILTNSLDEIEQFMNKQKLILQKNISESNQINKIYVVFRNQLNSIATKLKGIRITALNSKRSEQGQDQDIIQMPQIIKYTDKNRKIGHKILKKYVDQYCKAYPQAIELNNHQVFKEQKITTPKEEQLKIETIFLMKIIWGVLACPNTDRKKNVPPLNLKKDISRFQVAIMLNKLLIGMQVQ